MLGEVIEPLSDHMEELRKPSIEERCGLGQTLSNR